MDTLILKKLSFKARHGYYREERINGNKFEVDLKFHAHLQDAARDDDLSKTINYKKAEEIVRGIMTGPSVKLIETLNKRIGDALFNEFPKVIRLDISVRKLEPPLQTRTRYSEVRMTWQR